jgi:hypothetical protein
MNFLKRKMLDYLNKKANLKNKIPRNNTSFSNSKDIGLVFTWEGDSKYSQVLELVKVLEMHGKNVEMMCYIRNPKEQNLPGINLYYDKDISFFGKSKSEKFSKFLSKSFDFLLHLDLQTAIMVQYVLSRTNAKCRVGKNDMDNCQFYELMIRPAEEENFKDYCDQVLHYTKSIMTNA